MQSDLQLVCQPGWRALAFKRRLWKRWLGTQLERGCPSVALLFPTPLPDFLHQAVRREANRFPSASHPLRHPRGGHKHEPTVVTPNGVKLEVHPKLIQLPPAARSHSCYCAPPETILQSALAGSCFFHFWRGWGRTAPKEKEWRDGRNQGLEAQRGGRVGMLPESPHLRVCCTLPALQISAPRSLPPL